MDIKILKRHFAKIGAELQVEIAPAVDRRFGWRGASNRPRYQIDVRPGKVGEVFDLVLREDACEDFEFISVDVQAPQRHLLLLVRDLNDGAKQKFLCGHDERHWFVASVPDGPGVKNIYDAMEALKPAGVAAEQRRHKVKGKDWQKRRNDGFVRQGEWFFLPRPDFEPKHAAMIFRNEPIRRSGGTPHLVEYLYRTGGTTVYVCNRHPNGLTAENYRDLIARDPAAKAWRWRVMRRDAQVYAKGKIHHPDHQTIELPCWHRVMMSAEASSENVVFLD